VVGEVRDVLDLSGPHELRDLLREARLVDLIRQLRHDDALPAVRALLDARDRAHLDGATAGPVGVLDPVATEDLRAGREVRALDELHEVVGRRLRVVDEVHDAVDDLPEVVRGDVRRHADRDAAGAVHQQVREPRREDQRLLLVAVVVRDEVDRLGVDVAEELQRDLGETSLRVAGRRRRVAVDGAEVPVRIDERVSEGEVLGHPHQRVVDRRVAVRVVLAHHAADDVRGLPVGTIGPQTLLDHRPEDPAVDRLQAVADVRQGTRHDDRHRVVEVGALNLLLEADVLDASGEQILGHTVTRPGSGRPWRSPR
jgi:hypothetical protein